MSDVKIVRFLGEDLIAEVVSENNETITLKNPLRIVIIPNKADPKNPSVGFAPYCEWTRDEIIEVAKNLFVFAATPIPQFVQQYSAQFSGLILPETQILT